MKFHHRITWIDSVPYVQRCPVEVVVASTPWSHRTRPGSYAVDGEIVRPASADDLDAMANGRISYDPQTHPGTRAFARHVAAGGD